MCWTRSGELVDFPSMRSRHLALPSLQCLLTDPHGTNPDDRRRNFRFDAPTISFITPLTAVRQAIMPLAPGLDEAGPRSGRLALFRAPPVHLQHICARFAGAGGAARGAPPHPASSRP